MREECRSLNHIVWVLRKREQYRLPEKWKGPMADWVKKCGAINIYYWEVKEYYHRFVADFQKNPFDYMDGKDQPLKIETGRVDCYLIEAEGFIIPIGFLKEVDEDWRVHIRKPLAYLLGWSAADRKRQIEAEQDMVKRIGMAVKLERDMAEIQEKLYRDRHEYLSRSASRVS